MCGLAGIFDPRARESEAALREAVDRMSATLVHRGPDDRDRWTDAAAGIGLGHTRLSVIDLSLEGRQPMASASGRYRVVYNGEIYNFRRLRAELESAGHRFRGHSDTEVLLAAVSQWGVREALRRFDGMLAMALWDVEERRLTLARDRIGKKPLYFGWASGRLLFGSELKSLRAHPSFAAEIDRTALVSYLRYSYVPAPRSIYRDVYKLPPGTLLELSAERVAAGPSRDGIEAHLEQYWSALEVAAGGTARAFEGNDDEAIATLDGLLRDAVRDRLVADVPLGAFLSGGIDSSTVVALMQAQSDRPVRTFTIGFHETGYNEADDARAVAAHLGTDHTELYVAPREAMEVIPELPNVYDEPFADSSQIPTYLVSRLARRDVTVALSGDGGDELFGGYNRHLWAPRLWRRMQRVPRLVRKIGAASLTAIPPARWDAIAARVAPRQRIAGERLHKLAAILPASSPEEVYHGLTTHWVGAEETVIGGGGNATGDELDLSGLPGFAERMMLLDLVRYLPGDILVKLDRASMAVSLEARAPLLDHRVVEWAWRLPLSLKIRDGQGKWLLRRVLDRYVPRELIERPKFGFGVPIDEWLRGPLRGWAEELLDERAMRKEGFFRPGPIRQRWAEHLSGRQNRHHELWDVLMFQAWLREA